MYCITHICGNLTLAYYKEMTTCKNLNYCADGILVYVESYINIYYVF